MTDPPDLGQYVPEVNEYGELVSAMITPDTQFEDLQHAANVALLAMWMRDVREGDLDTIYGKNHPDRPARMTDEQALEWATNYYDAVSSGEEYPWPAL